MIGTRLSFGALFFLFFACATSATAPPETARSAVRVEETASTHIDTGTITGESGQQRYYPMVSTPLPKLDMIATWMVSEYRHAPPIDQASIATIQGLLARADVEEIQAVLDEGAPFVFSEWRRRVFWQATLVFAYLLLSEKDCERQKDFLHDVLPDLLRVLPPDAQNVYLAAERMLVIRMKDIYGCLQTL